jgi:hypothetical protein
MDRMAQKGWTADVDDRSNFSAPEKVSIVDNRCNILKLDNIYCVQDRLDSSAQPVNPPAPCYEKSR